MGCILPRTCYNTRMTNFHNDINADDQFLMHDAIEDARVGTLSLYVVHLSTKDWSSEYGCMFVVRAEDEDAARTIIDEDNADSGYHKGYDLHITEIGFTDATDPAIVSSFRT